MKLFKKIINPVIFKGYLSIFIMYFLINNPILIGSENKSDFFKNKHIENGFTDIYFENEIPFNAYDNLESQFKTFLGFYSYRAEKSFYPDLSIIKSSDSIREMYRFKLNDMAISEINYNINK